MTRLFLFFSHRLTAEQEQEAEQHWGVSQLLPLPPDLQHRFSEVPPQVDHIVEHARPLKDWLLAQSVDADDLVLIQGEYGLTYHLVHWGRAQGWRLVYATTPRLATEAVTENGLTITRTFRHSRFRLYE